MRSLEIRGESTMAGHRLLLLVLALVLSGCAPLPKQAFNKDAATAIKTVVIAQPPNQESYEAAILGHPAASFGLVGGLIAAADIQIKSSRLTTAIDVAETRLQDRFVKKLRETVLSAGYETSVITVPRDTPEDRTLSLLKQTGADAALIVAVVGRYWAAGPTSNYLPSIVVIVKKIDLKSSATLYQDTFSYGYSSPQTKTVHFASDSVYSFADIDVLISNPEKTREGLYKGIDVICDQIAADLKR